jgi:hypothetical protein
MILHICVNLYLVKLFYQIIPRDIQNSNQYIYSGQLEISTPEVALTYFYFLGYNPSFVSFHIKNQKWVFINELGV